MVLLGRPPSLYPFPYTYNTPISSVVVSGLPVYFTITWDVAFHKTCKVGGVLSILIACSSIPLTAAALLRELKKIDDKALLVEVGIPSHVTASSGHVTICSVM